MQNMNRKLGNYKTIMAMFAVATMMVIFMPAIASAQSSGTGLDGYTRVLWHGADSSIVIWKLDANFNVVYAVRAGPYAGWIPIGLTVGDDNYTRVIWRSTTGVLGVWLVDPNLNFVSAYAYGPYLGWLPESTSVDSGGYERVIWRHTLGYMSVWVLSPNQSQVVGIGSYANSGYVPGPASSATASNSTPASTSLGIGHTGQRGAPLPAGLTPHFQPLTSLPQVAQ